MEIKVGEYVRTECGIAKIKEISIRNEEYELDKDIMYIHQENYLHTCTKSQILKHSFNIIDLIEEGDYVNEQKVLCLKKNNDDCRDDIGTSYIEGIDIYLGYDESDIKTILTHEQYERNCYRLGDN